MHVFSQCAGSVNSSFGFGSGNPQIERDLDAAPDLDAADTLLRPLKNFYSISLYLLLHLTNKSFTVKQKLQQKTF
jgi:hypothetical protein